MLNSCMNNLKQRLPLVISNCKQRQVLIVRLPSFKLYVISILIVKKIIEECWQSFSNPCLDVKLSLLYYVLVMDILRPLPMSCHNLTPLIQHMYDKVEYKFTFLLGGLG